MLKNVLQGCFVAGVFGVWAVACSGAPDEQTAGAGDGKRQVANEDDEATAITAALHKNPKDPVALTRARDFNERNDKLVGLIETVEMGDGQQVKFYQRASGQRALSIKGRLGTPPVHVNAQGRSFEEIYRDLKPGNAVPRALLEADTALNERMLAQAEEPAVVPEAQAREIRSEASASNGRTVVTEDTVSPAENAGTELVEKRMYCDEFKYDWCATGGNSNFCNCYTTQDQDQVRSNLWYSKHAVAVPDGSVTVKISTSAEVVFRQVMFQDDAVQVVAQSPGCNAPLWSACGGLQATTHTQSIWGFEEGERVHRGMCSDQSNGFCSFP